MLRRLLLLLLLALCHVALTSSATPSPVKAAKKPSPKTTSPKKPAPSPKKVSPSPKKVAPSPKKAVPSPKKAVPSPTKASPSPKRAAPVVAPSKAAVTPSPKKAPVTKKSPPPSGKSTKPSPPPPTKKVPPTKKSPPPAKNAKSPPPPKGAKSPPPPKGKSPPAKSPPAKSPPTKSPPAKSSPPPPPAPMTPGYKRVNDFLAYMRAADKAHYSYYMEYMESSGFQDDLAAILEKGTATILLPTNGAIQDAGFGSTLKAGYIKQLLGLHTLVGFFEPGQLYQAKNGTKYMTYDTYPSKPSVPVFKLATGKLSFDGTAKSTDGATVFKDQFYRDKYNYIIAHSVTKVMKPYRFFG